MNVNLRLRNMLAFSSAKINFEEVFWDKYLMFVVYIKQDKNNFWKIDTIYIYTKIVLQNLIHTCWDSIKLLNKWRYKIYFESKLILLFQTVIIPFEYNFENIWKYKSSGFKVLGMFTMLDHWTIWNPLPCLPLPPPACFQMLPAESSPPLCQWPASSLTDLSPFPFPYLTRPFPTLSLAGLSCRQQWQFAPTTCKVLAIRPSQTS